MPESFNDQFWTHLDQLVTESEIIIDRPKNSPHPDHDDAIYPLDYGYLAGTMSGDGAGIDVWVGEQEKRVCGIICTIDLVKRDSEVKILVGCCEDEMKTISEFINQWDGMRGYLVRRSS